VVTQEDVRFSRFRRDDVGVFELKGMIEANTDRIADAESLFTDTSDAMYVAGSQSSPPPFTVFFCKSSELSFEYFSL
jgi:hypothetical protein